MEPPPDVAERGLRDHLGVLRRRIVILVVIPVVAVLAALGYSLRQPVVYQASAEVLFQQEQTTVSDPTPDQMVLSKRLDPNRVIQNEVRLAGSQLVRDRVVQQTGSAPAATAANVRDSDIIVITASGSTPEKAAAAANAWAAAYVAVSREQVQQQSTAGLDAITAQLRQIDDRLGAIDSTLADATTNDATRTRLTGERQALVDQRGSWTKQQGLVQADDALAEQNQVQVITPATPPSAPSQPATLRNVLLALLLGIAVALVVAYAVDQVDDVIRRPDDLERAAGRPVVAVVTGSAARDQFRTLALDDPLLRRDDTNPPFVLDELPPHIDARILLVPVRSHARKVRQNISLLEGLGQVVAGVALLAPAGSDAHPVVAAAGPVGEPATHDDVSPVR